MLNGNSNNPHENLNRSRGVVSRDSKSWIRLEGNITLPGHNTESREVSSSLGDRNCAFNTLGSVFFDLIKQGHQFKEETLLKIIQSIRINLPVLRQRLEMERNQGCVDNAHVTLVAALATFIHFIETNPNLSTINFIRYINRQNTKIEVAALLIGLAPALRALGAEEYKQSLLEIGVNEENGGDLLTEIPQLSQSGVAAGHEILSHLAKDVLEINLHMYEGEIVGGKKQIKEIWRNVLIPGAPTRTILINHDVLNPDNNHWTYLIPTGQANGLAACLTEAAPNAGVSAVSSNSGRRASPANVGIFSGSATHQPRVVSGKWTTKTEQELLRDDKKDLIRKANDILGSIFDKKGKVSQEQFVALFDSLEKAIHSSNSTDELLVKCKEFLNAKKSSSLADSVINNLTKFIDNLENNEATQRSSCRMALGCA